MSENYAQTPKQQLIAKLRECETTMTKGPYTTHFDHTVRSDNGHTFVCTMAHSGYKTLMNMYGIATLKNSNPTVIAMLERAIGALAYYARFSSDAATASAALAHLDALAREALKEKPDGKA